jgi:hypothetical protein
MWRSGTHVYTHGVPRDKCLGCDDVFFLESNFAKTNNKAINNQDAQVTKAN